MGYTPTFAYYREPRAEPSCHLDGEPLAHVG